MTTIEKFSTPGELLQSLLEARGWSQRALAVILEIGEATITRLLSGQQRVSAELAVVLEDVFDVPAAQFLSLQSEFDLANARKTLARDTGRATRACLHGDLPIGEMIRREWLPATNVRDAKRVEAALVRFFGVDSIEDMEIVQNATSKGAMTAKPAQLAWLRRVEQIASAMSVAAYSPQALHAAIARLRAQLGQLERVAEIPSLLAECGVRFVIVETLAAAKIDGACLWLNDRAPVIAMSLRIDRIDNFWFVLRHEIEHVARQHGRVTALIDVELEGHRVGTGGDVTDEDRVANEAARDFCVPSAVLDDFIARNDPLIAERDLIEFAQFHQVHPGILAGQIQTRTGGYGGRYNRFRAHLAKVRAIASTRAMTDGWGTAASVETGRRGATKPAPSREAVLPY